MRMGVEAADRCAEFGWQPHGRIDPGLVADTAQHSRFGIGRAWSKTATYRLSTAPNLLHLVYTVEGGFTFTVDGATTEADAGSLILLEGEASTTAETVAETARFVWYFEPTFLQPGRALFRLREPIAIRNDPLRALLNLTNSFLDARLPSSEPARRHLGMSIEHLVAGALEERGAAFRDADAQHRDGLFMAAQLAIEARFRDPAFTVAHLAKELSTSVRAVHNTFSRLGTTPRREIERRRLNEAGRLGGERLAAREVAERAGFSSLKRMRRALDRTRPHAPSESR